MVFSKYNSFLAFDTGISQFKMRGDHIDRTRGIIVDIQSKEHIIVIVCLQGNLDEYESGGMLT